MPQEGFNMYRIEHSDAIELEYQVRRLYQCGRGGVSGMADADYFEGHPLQAAVLVVAYIHANGMESGPYQYDDFLVRYEKKFEKPLGNSMQEIMREYLAELNDIVEEYV
jgi:hypothetical protein